MSSKAFGVVPAKHIGNVLLPLASCSATWAAYNTTTLLTMRTFPGALHQHRLLLIAGCYRHSVCTQLVCTTGPCRRDHCNCKATVTHCCHQPGRPNGSAYDMLNQSEQKNTKPLVLPRHFGAPENFSSQAVKLLVALQTVCIHGAAANLHHTAWQASCPASVHQAKPCG